MAETYSYDNTPETEVLTAEEQDSLQVGEQMVAEQEGLLAGKYKNTEDLEAAYLSLQKKLGQTQLPMSILSPTFQPTLCLVLIK